MKPCDENTKNFPTEIPAELQFKKCEYWVLKPQAVTNNATNVASSLKASSAITGNSSSPANLLYPGWFNSNSPLSYYRSFPVYQVPASITVEKMVDQLFGRKLRVSSRTTREDFKPETVLQELWEFIARDPFSNCILDVDYDISDESGRIN